MQLTIVKEEPWKLGQETTHTKQAKEELQDHDHQQSNPKCQRRGRKLRFKGGCKKASRKECNRWTSQSDIQEFFILPLDTKFYNS